MGSFEIKERRSATSTVHEPAAVERDEQLMERVSEGDVTALRTLVDRYWPRLVAYSSDILGDRDAAQDVVQETVVRVWKRRREWSASGAFSAYVYRIVRNLSLNARRDSRLRHERHVESGMLEPNPREPDEAAEANALRDEVEAAISRLSARRREVFILSRFHGLSHREIAESLGTSPQTVSNQISAALDELRRTLAHLLDDS